MGHILCAVCTVKSKNKNLVYHGLCIMAWSLSNLLKQLEWEEFYTFFSFCVFSFLWWMALILFVCLCAYSLLSSNLDLFGVFCHVCYIQQMQKFIKATKTPWSIYYSDTFMDFVIQNVVFLFYFWSLLITLLALKQINRKRTANNLTLNML